MFDLLSFPSLPTLTPDSSHLSEVHHLGKNVSHSPTFLCFKNFKMVAKHFIKKNWPSTTIDVHCRLHLSLLLKNIRTKMFNQLVFTLSHLLFWVLWQQVETCSFYMYMYLKFISCCFCSYIYAERTGRSWQIWAIFCKNQVRLSIAIICAFCTCFSLIWSIN